MTDRIYNTDISSRTVSSLVAQLVTNRTTVCSSSSRSQKLKLTFSWSLSICLFSKTMKIWFVGDCR